MSEHPEEPLKPVDARAPTFRALAPDLARTFQENPRATIDPERQRIDTSVRTAMEQLDRVSLAPTDAGRRAFHVERTLGEGGMGIVHLGTQPSLGRRVAIKSLKPDSRDDASRLRLLREAWVTGALEHPNVIPVYDLALDEHDGPVIVLKRIEGTEWNALMFDHDEIRKRFRADDALEWNLRVLMQICNAVRAAHARGVVHRDIKPDNVMIGNFGEVYLLDWGIAVALVADPEGRLPVVADATQLAGTLCYLAPEMLGESPSRISERTDVYLLGAVLFEIATGRPPHAGPSAIEMMQQAWRSDPELPDDVDPELSRIVRRAMARDPDERFESAEQFRLALEGYLRHRGSRQISDIATERLHDLTDLLARPDAADEAVRAEVYDAFGECRFGFEHALTTWRENTGARDGLHRALLAMARYELANGDVSVAARLVAQTTEAPAELRAEIALAEAKYNDERQRLERLARDSDASVGRRTRLLLSVIMGSVWTIAPLIIQFVPVFRSTHLALMLLPMAMCVPAGALAWWARESLSRTAPNRILRAVVSSVLIGSAMVQLALWLMGTSVSQAALVNYVLWSAGSAAIAISVEPWLWVAVAAYLAGMFLSAWRPEWLWGFASGANGVLLATLAQVWRLTREEWAVVLQTQRAGRFRLERALRRSARRQPAGGT